MPRTAREQADAPDPDGRRRLLDTRAIRAAGASRARALRDAVLPTALLGCPTYVLDRRSAIIRTTVVVGFVVAAGLDREFRLRMSFVRNEDGTRPRSSGSGWWSGSSGERGLRWLAG